ncbi:unnamed protein product [Mytilus edulis]|uniref:SGNH hydrolase-type esterase domain-containing protein n=1 Tax=Mytilus edulis TaxID=6550 RepID=A0A8S3S4I1_MYTED|nr:unnamed protein product [Mytilus edulis]
MDKRAVVFGHSFIRRLNDFVLCNKHNGWSNLSLDERDILVNLFGSGGGTVRQGPKCMFQPCLLKVIADDKPDVVFLQVGGNDIKHDSVDPKLLARDITSFAEFIIDGYDVKHVIVGQLLQRFNANRPYNYNEIVNEVNTHVKLIIKNIDKLSFWHHRGMWSDSESLIANDGVHLNKKGTLKFANSIRSALGICMRRGLF